MRAEKYLPLLLLGLAIGSVIGLVHLFALRFAMGDVYPPYSSLRADPLGTKVLFESLRSLPHVSARRNYQPLSRLCDQKKQTVFCCGVHPYSLSDLEEAEARDYENLAASGNRFVISLYAVSSAPPKPRHKDAAEDESGDTKKSHAKKKSTDNKGIGETGAHLVDLTNRWGFAMAYASKEKSSDTATQTIWHTALYFDQLDKHWRVTQSNDEHAVVIERSFGAGTIVLCADSYFLSNEAMRKDRQPESLAELIGVNTDIVFDETHLGVSEHPGVMSLAYKYHLQGLFVAIILLVGLFIWKSSVSFLPRRINETAATSAVVSTDKDTAAGLVNLLRRSVPPQELLRVCWDEWQKSFARGFGRLARNREKAQVVVDTHANQSARGETIVTVYQDISQLLAGRK
ncbi:MAG TPA: DUF4350 domain-containing protein [Verrucomicrobiae bacterium]|nr:DUF4350 domain-containing protein [Verrucomicrobiae bacterium]